MTQITLTLDLTPETYKLLEKFVKDTPGISVPDTVVYLDNVPVSEDTPVTLTDVRALALKLSKAGHQKVLKDIFASFGAEKLSDIPEANYPALMTDLVKANG